MSILKRLRRIISAEIDSRLNSSNTLYDGGVNFRDSDYNKSELNSKLSVNSSIEEQYYANLELSNGASFEQIKKSYKNLLKQYHPDKYHNDDRAEDAEQISKKLNEAYNYFENKYKEQQ